MQKTIVLPKNISTIQTKHNRKVIYVTRPNQIISTIDGDIKDISSSNIKKKNVTRKLITKKNKSSLHKRSNYGPSLNDSYFSLNKSAQKISRYSSSTPDEKKRSNLHVTYSSEICPCKCHNNKSVSKYSTKDYYSENEKRISKSVKIKSISGNKKKRVLVKTFLCKPEAILYSYITKPDLKYSYEEKISISEYESKKMIKKSWMRDNDLCKEDSFCIINDYGYPMNNYSQLMLLEEYEEKIKKLEKILAQKEMEIRDLNNEYYNNIVNNKNNITRYDTIYYDWNQLCEPYKIEYLYIKGLDREPLCHQHNVINFDIIADKKIPSENLEKNITEKNVLEENILEKNITEKTFEKHEKIVTKVQSSKNEQQSNSFDMIRTEAQLDKKNENIKKTFDIENIKIENQNDIFIKKNYEFDQNSNTKTIFSKNKFDILEIQKSGFTLLSLPIDARLKNENQDNFIIQGIPTEEIDIDENILDNNYYKLYGKHQKQASTTEWDSANYDLNNQTSRYYASSDNRTINELKKIGVSTDSSRELVNVILGLPENDIEHMDNMRIRGHKRYNSELRFKNNYNNNYNNNINNSQYDKYFNESQYNSYYKNGSRNKFSYNNYLVDESNYNNADGRWNKIKEVNVTNLYSSENDTLPKGYSIQRKMLKKRIMKKNFTDSNLLKEHRNKSSESYNEMRKHWIQKGYKVSTEPKKKVTIERQSEKERKSNLERSNRRKFYHLEHGDNKVVVLSDK